MAIDPLCRSGLLREAVRAVDRGASVHDAAARYGLNADEVREAAGFTSPTRVAMTEARAYRAQAAVPTSVCGY